jgi:flagellin
MSSFGDLSRINTNVQSLQAYNNLNRTNVNLGVRQLRLSTGSRINSGEDDSAGYSISKKLEAKVRSQAQALANIGDAKSLLTVAEGSLNSIMDILQTMKEKAIQAANDTMGTSERAAIKGQLDELTNEIGDILSGTEFNKTSLFSATTATLLKFHVGAGTAAYDTFNVRLASIDNGTVLFAGVNASVFATGSWAVSSNSLAAHASGIIDKSIQTISDQLGGLGDYQRRLSFKYDNLTVSMNNYESARSRIADADFAKEQMEIVKLQILQQTGTAALAQANAAPQSVLALIGG